MPKAKRLYSIDVFRVVCALFIFLFHARGAKGIEMNFGILQYFVSYGTLFMTAFFMLSGFSLHYVNCEREAAKESAENTAAEKSKDGGEGASGPIALFYLKRLAGIYPLYAFTALAAILLFNELPLSRNIMLIPLEATLLQSIYPKSFYVSHFGGTWFVSCVFICYLIFPFAKNLVRRNSAKANAVILGFLWFFSAYQFILLHFYDFIDDFTVVYNNPMVRFLEFFAGMLAADFFERDKDKPISKKAWLLVPLVFLALASIVTATARFKPVAPQFFNFFAFPAFAAILYLCARLESAHPFVRGRELILLLSENTYAFFLAQFFTWTFAAKINEGFLRLQGFPLLAFCLLWCCAVSAAMHYLVEKPCKKAILGLISKRWN